MPGKMLYFGPSGIGDWCFIYPSLQRLMAENGCDELHIIVPYRNPGNELLALHPQVGSLRWLNRKTSFIGLIGYGLRWLKLLLWVRRQRFDALAVSYLSNQPDFLLLAALSSIKTRIGRNTGASLQQKAFTKPIEMPDSAGKVVIHAAYSSESTTVEQPLPLIDESLYKDWQNTCSRFQLPADFIVLGVGGGREAWWRFWPAEHYRALIQSLPDHHFVLLGGGADDNNQAEQIMQSGLNNATNLVSQTSFVEGVAIMRGSVMVVGNDSGLCNISATLGIPSLCLYGPTDPAINGPALVGAEVVKVDISCAPCFNDDQDPTAARQCSHRDCLQTLPPAEVAERIKAHLSKSPLPK